MAAKAMEVVIRLTLHSAHRTTLYIKFRGEPMHDPYSPWKMTASDRSPGAPSAAAAAAIAYASAVAFAAAVAFSAAGGSNVAAVRILLW